MDEGSERRRDSSSSHAGAANGRAPLYSMPSHQSGSSIFEDVEMAQNELYAGPMAESLPTSVSAFSHRRRRADSLASFTYHQDDEDEAMQSLEDQADFEGSQLEDEYEDEDIDNESLFAFREDMPDYASRRRRSSTLSRSSTRAHLLRHDSVPSVGSARATKRLSQKTYLVNEDLTMVVAGFETSRIGYLAYLFLCFFTLGIAYLLFRWLPRWYIAVVGSPCPLGDCRWVVIENQWGEMAILDVETKPYGRPLSTVFGYTDKAMMYDVDDDFDPLLPELRILSYRYVRLFFHPVKDIFVLFNGWKDPAWTDVKEARSGVDADEKSTREVVFGSNLIDIEQKSIPKLLVDEALHPFYIFQIASLTLWSLDQYYYYAICIFLMSVGSITTTLIETRAVCST
jgi:cation-transporting ATPase 13A2